MINKTTIVDTLNNNNREKNRQKRLTQSNTAYSIPNNHDVMRKAANQDSTNAVKRVMSYSNNQTNYKR